jgi:hypothetical protein
MIRPEPNNKIEVGSRTWVRAKACPWKLREAKERLVKVKSKPVYLRSSSKLPGSPLKTSGQAFFDVLAVRAMPAPHLPMKE